MSQLHDKVIAGLEKTANSSGHELVIRLFNHDGAWCIQFEAGKAAVMARLSSFVAAPKIVLDPFVEEVIKRNL